MILEIQNCYNIFIAVAKTRNLHYQGQSLDFTLQTSNRIGHQLTTEVLKIFLEEVLGYQHIKLIQNGGDLSLGKIFKNMFESFQHSM